MDGVDSVVLDLGVSSMHLDRAERGFSFANDGPLDMRMGESATTTAEEIVNAWPEEEIGRILREYGEEKHWRLLARRICERRAEREIRTTRELVDAIGNVPGKWGSIHPATRTFQGIRIAVNDELGAVEDVIPAAIDALRPGGRLAIISFHSLEDSIVKRRFRHFAGRAEPLERGGESIHAATRGAAENRETDHAKAASADERRDRRQRAKSEREAARVRKVVGERSGVARRRLSVVARRPRSTLSRGTYVRTCVRTKKTTGASCNNVRCDVMDRNRSMFVSRRIRRGDVAV